MKTILLWFIMFFLAYIAWRVELISVHLLTERKADKAPSVSPADGAGEGRWTKAQPSKSLLPSPNPANLEQTRHRGRDHG